MNNTKWTYFAYGSNLLQARLKARTPSAVVAGIGILRGHQLKFHKIGDDGSAKCDAFQTDDSEDIVWGRLYQLDPAEKPILDAIEGVGHGYELKEVNVACGENQVSAWVYVVQPGYIQDKLKPFAWYHRFVLLGARECGFPPAYIDQIRQIETRRDPDISRAEKNHQIMSAL